MITTEYKEIIFSEDFKVLNKVYDLGKQAEVIRNLAIDAMGKEGVNAKIHCSNVVQWMEEIAEQAQQAIDLKLQESGE